MEPAGAPPPSCAPAREAEEPPGSPALPAERPRDGEPARKAREEAAAAERSHGRGPAGRAARGGGRHGPEERGARTGRRPRVTVDSSKAKTSLEALKISLRQLRWREVSTAPRGAARRRLSGLRPGPGGMRPRSASALPRGAS